MNQRIIQAAVGFDRTCVVFSDSSRSEWFRELYRAKQLFKVYNEDDEPRWSVQDSQLSISCFCKFKYLKPSGQERVILAILSVDGIVSFAGKEEGSFEKIPLTGDGDDDLGDVFRIRQIESFLYVVGARRQIHRRDPSGAWTSFHGDLLQSISDTIRNPTSLNDINGSSNANLYAVGDGGQICRHDGLRWQAISSPTKETLEEICVADDKTVLICGHNGTVLRGNHHDGFVDVGPLGNSENFTSIAIFEDVIYLAHEKGLCVFDGTSIERADTGLRPELSDGCRLFAIDGVLWSVGYHEIARLSGGRWERIKEEA